MDIVLSFNNHSEILKLSVLPAELQVSTGLKNNTFEVISLGEIGVIGERKLSTIAISSFFPKHYSSFCQYTNIPAPYVAVAQIEKWRDSKKPIRLTVTGTPVNMACMIEDFSYKEKGGQPGDVYYDLSLKEYRFISARIITEKNGQNGKLTVENKRPVDVSTPSKYTVKSGDSLYVIAKRFYGDGSKWKSLYEKNKKIIGSNPNVIRPGQVLVL